MVGDGVNDALALPIAAGVFAFAGVSLSPEIAALSMSGSIFRVAVNALLLKRLRLPRPGQPGPAPWLLTGLWPPRQDAKTAAGGSVRDTPAEFPQDLNFRTIQQRVPNGPGLCPRGRTKPVSRVRKRRR